MGIIKYTYTPKNKLPHQIAFYAESEWNSSFSVYRSLNKDEIVLWLRENIGKGNITWRRGISSEQIYSENYVVNYLLWGYSFYFLNKEDALLFRLTWG